MPEPAEAPDQKIPLQEWAPSEVAELDLYEKREKIYTRKIEGFYQRLRQYTGWPLLLGYFCLPWLTWSDRQAVLFDLPARKFYIFGLILVGGVSFFLLIDFTPPLNKNILHLQTIYLNLIFQFQIIH